MTDTSHPEPVYVDDILGEDGVESMEHVDGRFATSVNKNELLNFRIGWPCMGIRFSSGSNVTHHLSALLDAASKNSEKFQVYTHDTMPERFHFVNNPRIAPVYVIPKIGYALTTRKEGDVIMSKGVSSADPHMLSLCTWAENARCRIMDTTTTNPLCLQHSSLMAPLQRPSRISITSAPPRSQALSFLASTPT